MNIIRPAVVVASGAFLAHKIIETRKVIVAERAKRAQIQVDLEKDLKAIAAGAKTMKDLMDKGEYKFRGIDAMREDLEFYTIVNRES